MALVLSTYPGYRLEHIWLRPVWDGGVSPEMLGELFSQADKLKYNEMRFNAAIHGIDLTEGESVQGEEEKQQSGFVFKAPEEYEAMDPEERKKETERMMSHWKNFSIGSGS